MFTVDELSRKVADCQRGRVSLEQFDDWFEDNSCGAYADPQLRELYAQVDAVLARYFFDNADEAAVKAELENTIRPLVEARQVVFGWKPFHTSTSSQLLAVTVNV